jgi:hypothetical protein
VWTPAQASRFVESILLGLPIPSVFLYREEESNRHLIVDGLQRLSTLHAFATGRFPQTQAKFRLKRVQQRYEGRGVNDLEASDQRRFFDTVIHSIIIQQLAPDRDRSSVFHIFERLNSNGTPLRAQEMRAAIYHGEFQDLLVRLNDYPDWRTAFGPPNKRSKDQELILRFLALRHDRQNYRKPMAAFLNHFMAEMRSLPGDSEQRFSREFCETVSRIVAALGPNAFKPRKSFNVALFDAVMVAVSENTRLPPDKIQAAYSKLVQDEEFRFYTERATSDEVSVGRRIEIAQQAF